ncbi:LysR substrate-binding domain-containing protein [Streptomyces sp. NPDC001970]
MPADHPLAKRRAVPIAELAGLDPVDSLVGCVNRTVVDRAFAAASVDRCVAIEITSVATGVAFVRNGLGGTVATPGPAAVSGPPSGRTPGAAPRAMIAMVREFLT